MRHREGAMSMYFLDETDDWPEYEIIKAEIQHLDKQHLDLRKELEEVATSLQSDTANQDLKAKSCTIKKKLEEIERKLDESLSMYR